MLVGRNMKEVEWLLAAFQTADKEMVFTPANWKQEDDLIVPHYPSTSEELAANPTVANNFYNVGGLIRVKRKNKIPEN